MCATSATHWQPSIILSTHQGKKQKKIQRRRRPSPLLPVTFGLVWSTNDAGSNNKILVLDCFGVALGLATRYLGSTQSVRMDPTFFFLVVARVHTKTIGPCLLPLLLAPTGWSTTIKTRFDSVTNSTSHKCIVDDAPCG